MHRESVSTGLRRPLARRPLTLLAVLSLALILGSCDQGHHFVGPSVAVQNGSGRAIVVRQRTKKWSIDVGEARVLLPQLPTSAWEPVDPVQYDILDAASCEVIGGVVVDFKATGDTVIVVPPSGSVTAVRSGSQPVASGVVRGGGVTTAPFACLGPTDGWTAWIVNSTSVAYDLTVSQDEYAPNAGPYTVRVPPHSSRCLTSAPRPPLPMYAGSFDLKDTKGVVIDKVAHDAWGRFMVAIDDGALTLRVRETAADVPPTPSASPAPSSGGSPAPASATEQCDTAD